MNQPWRPALLFSVLAARSGSGLDGPACEPLTGGSGLCHEINLGDGHEAPAEVRAAFDASNPGGLVDPFAPLVHAALASDRTAAALRALTGSLSMFDSSQGGAGGDAPSSTEGDAGAPWCARTSAIAGVADLLITGEQGTPGLPNDV